MRNIFFISDPHLFHANFLTFKDNAGKLIRPFANVEEMNERFAEGYNSVVRDGDIAYWLGDITWDYSEKFDKFMSRLRGSKRLILGNHDEVKGTGLVRHFKKVGIWRVFKEYNFICSHIPLHPCKLERIQFNVHGDLHQNHVPDLRYINVCVEPRNYTPVSLEEIQMVIASRAPLLAANDNEQLKAA